MGGAAIEASFSSQTSLCAPPIDSRRREPPVVAASVWRMVKMQLASHWPLICLTDLIDDEP